MDIAALIAADPALIGPAIDAVRAGADGAAAVNAAAEAQAALLAALPDPDLAQRAGDVRQVAAAVVEHLCGTIAAPPPAGKFILVRREVDPADLIRLAEAGLAGAVSVGGGASSHAAIIARGLGLPMLAGADPQVLAAPAGHYAILDTSAGELIVDPGDPELTAARAATSGASGVRARRPPAAARIPTSGPLTASRSRCCATSPRPPRCGWDCPAARRASACCAPRSPSPAPPAGRPRPTTWRS